MRTTDVIFIFISCNFIQSLSQSVPKDVPETPDRIIPSTTPIYGDGVINNDRKQQRRPRKGPPRNCLMKPPPPIGVGAPPNVGGTINQVGQNVPPISNLNFVEKLKQQAADFFGNFVGIPKPPIADQTYNTAGGAAQNIPKPPNMMNQAQSNVGNIGGAVNDMGGATKNLQFNPNPPTADQMIDSARKTQFNTGSATQNISKPPNMINQAQPNIGGATKNLPPIPNPPIADQMINSAGRMQFNIEGAIDGIGGATTYIPKPPNMINQAQPNVGNIGGATQNLPPNPNLPIADQMINSGQYNIGGIAGAVGNVNNIGGAAQNLPPNNLMQQAGGGAMSQAQDSLVGAVPPNIGAIPPKPPGPPRPPKYRGGPCRSNNNNKPTRRNQ